MNTENYTPFLVSEGDLMQKIHDFQKDRAESIATREALFAKYGAKNGWGTDSYLSALVFEGDAPEGWRRDKKSGAHKPPIGNAGKEIRNDLNASRILGGSDFSHVIGLGGCISSSGNGGLCIRYAYYEQIGDALILMIPTAEKEWTHADCRALKMSEYFAMKEAFAK